MKYQALRPQFFSVGWWGGWWGWWWGGWWWGRGGGWGGGVGLWWGRGGGLGMVGWAVMAHEISGIKAPIFLHGWVGVVGWDVVGWGWWGGW